MGMSTAAEGGCRSVFEGTGFAVRVEDKRVLLLFLALLLELQDRTLDFDLPGLERVVLNRLAVLVCIINPGPAEFFQLCPFQHEQRQLGAFRGLEFRRTHRHFLVGKA